MPFQIAQFGSAPIRDCEAFATIGLSSHPLEVREAERWTRLELLMIVRTGNGPTWIPSLLETVGARLVRARTAVLRGDVIGPRDALAPGSELTALYASSPAYLPDEFATCEVRDGVKCAIVWLVPIGSRESAFVKNRGWLAFEEALVRENPDLVALDRAELDAAITDGARS
jgi:hypothetical protein